MAREEIEIYERLTGRKKKYIVFNINYPDSYAYDFAKKFFKCSQAHICYVMGFIYKGKLYWEDPEMPGTRVVSVMYYVR